MSDKKQLLSDERLAVLAKSGDEEALEYLLERYKPLMRSLSLRYFIRGADRDDVVQEAMIALFKTVQNYDPDEGFSFAAAAARRSEQAVIDAIRKAEAKKNKILNDSVSLENYEPGQDELGRLAAAFEFPERNAAELAEKLKQIQKLLSPMEYEVFFRRLKGLSYQEIAADLGSDTKAVDNALQRIRNKMKNKSDLLS